VALAGKERNVLVLGGGSLRRSCECRVRWAWALARLSASIRKSELDDKPARYGRSTGPTLIFCCKLSESSKVASSMSSWTWWDYSEISIDRTLGRGGEGIFTSDMG
jgi:hypothetical protein